VFGGVGRINCVSGATTVSEHRKRDALLTKLFTTGRLQLLSAIRRGDLTVNELYAATWLARSRLAPTDVVLKRRLWDALDAWQPTCARAPATRTRAAVAIRALRRSRVLGEGAAVADLATVDWAALYNRNFIGPTGWNHIRRTISRFLTMLLGDKFHEYRRRVLAQWPRAEEPERVPDLPPALFWTILGPHGTWPSRCGLFVTIVAAGLGEGVLRLPRHRLAPAQQRACACHGAKVGARARRSCYSRPTPGRG